MEQTRRTALTDSKGRISLGAENAANYYVVEDQGNGDIVLRRQLVIPESDLDADLAARLKAHMARTAAQNSVPA